MTERSDRKSVFISYSRRDTEHLEELKLHLKPLERMAEVLWWADTRLKPGTEWLDEILEAISKARIAVFLVSPNFLASDFIMNQELPPLLEAARRREITILSVILSPCIFTRIEALSRYQAINDPAQPLVDLGEGDRGRVWVKLVEEILNILSPSSTLSLSLTGTGPPVAEAEEERAEVESAPSADIEVMINIDEKDDRSNVTFIVNTLPEFGVHYKLFGPTTLRREPEQFLDDAKKITLEGLGSDRAGRRRIEALGSAFLEELIPEELQELLTSLAGRARTLQLVSDLHWVPWELLTLGRNTGGQYVQFLSEAFALTRWLPGVPQVLRFPLERIALVAASSALPGTFDAEIAAIERLAGDREAVRISARYVEVTDALASGSYDGWHFATQGGSRSSRARAWIALETERLTPVDLSGSAGRLGATRPLVVLSGPPIVGWERALLKAGAGAIVGPLWDSTDQTAFAFSVDFYGRFLGGTPLAQAVHEARLAVRDQYSGDSSWLAFTAYGHPLATCGAQEAADHREGTASQPGRRRRVT